MTDPGRRKEHASRKLISCIDFEMRTFSIADPAFIFDVDYGRYGPEAGFSIRAMLNYSFRFGENGTLGNYGEISADL